MSDPARKYDPRQRQPEVDVSDVQRTYARWLWAGGRLAMLGLLASFALYVSGALDARVPPSELYRYWHLRSREYVQATGAPAGWCCLTWPPPAETLCLLPIAALASLSLACYLRVLPMAVRRRFRVMSVLLALEVLVLALAASGVLTAC